MRQAPRIKTINRVLATAVVGAALFFSSTGRSNGIYVDATTYLEFPQPSRIAYVLGVVDMVTSFSVDNSGFQWLSNCTDGILAGQLERIVTSHTKRQPRKRDETQISNVMQAFWNYCH